MVHAAFHDADSFQRLFHYDPVSSLMVEFIEFVELGKLKAESSKLKGMPID
jgi:hypothetical protein